MQVKTKKALPDNPDLKYVLFWFVLFSIIFLVILFLHFYQRTNFNSGRLLEIYIGSEATIKLIPDHPDRYKAARSLGGILKLHVWHFIAIPVYAFTLIHLVQSLGQSNRYIIIATRLYFIIILLVLLGPFIFFINAWFGLVAYYFSFFLFEILSMSLTFILFILLIKN